LEMQTVPNGLDLSKVNAFLRRYCNRDLAWWIAAALAKAGIATPRYHVNRWVISHASLH
jgi:hypothetical protein